VGLFGPKIKDGVATEGTVIRMAPTEKAGRQNEKRNVDFEFLLSIRVQGATSVLEVGHTCKVPHDKVPAMGQQIPVTVSAGDPSRLRIEFGDMPTLAEATRPVPPAPSDTRFETSRRSGTHRAWD
jgi:hypothetical protein